MCASALSETLILSSIFFSSFPRFVYRQHGGPDQGAKKRGQGHWAGEEGEIHTFIHIENCKGTPTTIACHTHWQLHVGWEACKQLRSYRHKRKSYIVKADISPSHTQTRNEILCDQCLADMGWQMRNRGWLREWAYTCLTATGETNTLKGEQKTHPTHTHSHKGVNALIAVCCYPDVSVPVTG